MDGMVPPPEDDFCCQVWEEKKYDALLRIPRVQVPNSGGECSELHTCTPLTFRLNLVVGRRFLINAERYIVTN